VLRPAPPHIFKGVPHADVSLGRRCVVLTPDQFFHPLVPFAKVDVRRSGLWALLLEQATTHTVSAVLADVGDTVGVCRVVDPDLTAARSDRSRRTSDRTGSAHSARGAADTGPLAGEMGQVW
jgi:hypothetical protein